MSAFPAAAAISRRPSSRWAVVEAPAHARKSRTARRASSAEPTSLGAGFGGVSMTSSDYQDTILGEATETAVKQVAEKLVAARNRLDN